MGAKAPLYQTLSLVLFLGLWPSIASALELPRALEMAHERDGSLSALEARASGLREQSVAAGRLPDPKLLLGYEESEMMSEFMVGVRQEFPRSSRLNLRSQQFEHQADAQLARQEDWQRQLNRNVQRAYLELWYQQRAVDIVDHHSNLLRDLADVARQQYAAGRLSQQQMLMLELEQAMQQDRLTGILSARDDARSALARWVGEAAWQQKLPHDLPDLASVPPVDELLSALPAHPAITADDAAIRALESDVRLSGQYYSGFMVDALYARADNDDQTFTIMVEVGIPIAPGRLQERNASAARQRSSAASLDRIEKLRQLESDLRTQHQRWQHLQERIELSRTTVLPHSRIVSDAAASGYQNLSANFDGLLRAAVYELENQLRHQRLLADAAQVQANLLYYSNGAHHE
ncbi:outer membrane protein [Desulfurispirillum indicum S5]|uniref:Outer membrane protein n=1 Tax=Desulfurispirillum indicum (strain ATCC BAA-1389 / DSM 22839 / S5) TaxID=653733 RepID=E6W4R4_DESIS|nr:TolC family protein [Desulfurispirillum indicum]ADU64792.1 outer membrane protein [Desulfurispirillum indicum S5]